MKFNKKTKIKSEVDSSSMSDIVFILLLFFMVSTVFRQFSGIPVDLPSAKKIKKLDAKKNVVNLWANKDGEISIDDKIVDLGSVANVMWEKVSDNPNITTSLKIDRSTEMSLVSDLHEELREAGALRVNYCAKTGQ